MRVRVGIPRALFYHYYYPGLEEFFTKLGLRVILSPQTNKEILDKGVNKAVDDLCLPFKAFYGHAQYLFDKVDYLLVPRLISLGKKNYVCPKFMGLPDMMRAAFNKTELPPFLEPDIDLRKGLFPLKKIAHQLGKQLKVNYWRVEYAFWKALRKQYKFENIETAGFTPEESMKILKNIKLDNNYQHDRNLRIAVLGHAYILNDDYMSMGLLNKIREMGVKVITQEMISVSRCEKAALMQAKKLFWYYNRHIMGAAYHLLSEAKEKIDGLIQVNAFGCGPDSLVNELIALKGKENDDISLLNINLDEHSGQAGLITRLEAFIDLLERRKIG